MPALRDARRWGTVLTVTSLLLLCVSSPPHSAVAANVDYLSDPDSFFVASSPALAHDGTFFRLVMTTPIPVLCAIHHGPAAYGNVSDVNEMSTMDMSSPSEVHDVKLPLEPGSETTILLTAFLPGGFRRVLRSAPYVAVARVDSPSLTLSDTFAGGASAPSDDEMEVCPYELTAEAKATSAALALAPDPPRPTAHSIAFRAAPGGDAYIERSGPSGAQAVPDLFLGGLEPGTTYEVDVCLVDTRAELCCGAEVRFTTEEASSGGGSELDCLGDNSALLSLGASVMDVSSVWGNGGPDSTFSSNNAIDGRAATMWSSAGDGDSAFIAVRLPAVVPIAGVGVWSRSMSDGSSKIKSFSVALSRSDYMDGEGMFEVGPYELESTTEMHRFDLRADLGQAAGKGFDLVRMDVVTSTGGNTGVRSFEVYPLEESCEGDDSVVQNPTGTSQAGTNAPTAAPVGGDEPPTDALTAAPAGVDKPLTDAPTAAPADRDTPLTEASSSGLVLSKRLETMVLGLGTFLWTVLS